MKPKPHIIMLVDDDPDFLEMNQHILEGAGYAVQCCADPQTALQKMAGQRPSLVVTDLMMKSLDAGFSFARQIKQHARLKDVPVVIVTAVSSQRGFDFRPRTADELAAMCADAFFEKPVAPETLLNKVRELLKSRDEEVKT
ncbi:MAG: response regulator [Planctomycetes bacterium]|nr:response regulator [Planctomycetota bacterium]